LSQVPSVPQGLEVSLVHAPLGSRVPAVTGPQAPFLPAAFRSPEQLWHRPSQLLSQQYPAEQNPVLHCSWEVHAWPLSSAGVHTPLLQKWPTEQSVVAEHDAIHAVP